MHRQALARTCVAVALWAAGVRAQNHGATAGAPDWDAVRTRVTNAVARAQDNAGREAANWVMEPGSWPRIEAILAGRIEADPAAHWAYIRPTVEAAEKGPSWPRPGVCRVPRAAAPPAIDGVADDAVWQAAWVSTNVFAFGETAAATGDVAVTWRMLWDDAFLYVAFECRDADLVAPALPRDGNVFENDCVEVFLLPEPRSGAYWEVVAGADGNVFDALHAKRWSRFGMEGRTGEDMRGLRVGARADGTLNEPGDRDRGFCVELALPFAEFPEYSRARPAAGQTLHIMLVRIDRSDGVFRTYAFQPLLVWGHNIWNHAPVVLVDGMDAERDDNSREEEP